MGILDDRRLDWEFLRAYQFDAKRFEREATRIQRGELTEASSIVPKERLRPAPREVVTDLPPPGSAKRDALEARGREALSKGQVASVVLNGGMATRFGGVVKGVVEVFDQTSFLALKAEDVGRAARTFGAPIPLILMNSFATSVSTHEHLRAHDRFGLDAKGLLDFNQSVSIRLNPDGSLFIGKDGKPSYHAPGHGDFFECIRASRVLAQMKRRGVRVLLFSNVDNLGATVDPAIIGLHLELGADMTAEVTEKRRTASGAWDKGGAPCLVDGKLQVLEGFRFPKDFQQEQLPDFSTNNMLFSADGIDQELHLERHVVRKTVDDHPALQLESITCEASGLADPEGHPRLRLGLARVPREGATGRFFPVKEPIDLETLRPVLKDRLEQGWKLRDG
jgi:UTP--glucose-1-phosphate uridylyltransferase